MTKKELTEYLEREKHRATVLYGIEALTYAADVDAPRKLKKAQNAGRVLPTNLRQQEWENYLSTLEQQS
jgi:hypothetical protein